jgi:hypothetical protein
VIGVLLARQPFECYSVVQLIYNFAARINVVQTGKQNYVGRGFVGAVQKASKEKNVIAGLTRNLLITNIICFGDSASSAE